MWWMFVLLAAGVGSWLLSYVIDGLRRAPEKSATLGWAPEGAQVTDLDIGGVKVRYLKAGEGPDLVLLHTLRTQLDIYQGMIGDLAKQFTVHAIDYPGHGWSDIPDARFAPDDFYRWVEQFLEKADVKDAIVAGTSIGGTIPLVLAARGNSRIAKVVSINPYDYAVTNTSGLKGSSFWARIVHAAVEIPFVGEIFMRYRMKWMERLIFEGGVADKRNFSNALFEEMSGVGNRPGYISGFISLVRESQSWQKARETYPEIKVPVLLIWADQDWAPQADRERTSALIPNVKVVTLENAGHFLPLDKPDELAKLIGDFAAGV